MPTTPGNMEHQPQPDLVLVATGQGVPEVGANEYRETMDAMGRLAGKVAHHLNNLITVIEGNASLLEDELVDGPFASELREIRDACGRATDLSTQLLSIGGYRWR
jgi:signal transduction histidine kinase